MSNCVENTLCTYDIWAWEAIFFQGNVGIFSQQYCFQRGIYAHTTYCIYVTGLHFAVVVLCKDIFWNVNVQVIQHFIWYCFAYTLWPIYLPDQQYHTRWQLKGFSACCVAFPFSVMHKSRFPLRADCVEDFVILRKSACLFGAIVNEAHWLRNPGCAYQKIACCQASAAHILHPQVGFCWGHVMLDIVQICSKMEVLLRKNGDDASDADQNLCNMWRLHEILFVKPC